MTENEAIEQLKQEEGARFWFKILSSKEIAKIQAGDFYEFVEACKLSISALKEIQEYRATGLSPSMIEDLKKSEKQAHKDAMENALKLEEYEALGTVDELREALRESIIYNQVAWEHDIAIRQLKEIGCKLGQKMDKIKEAMEKQKAKKPIRIIVGSNGSSTDGCPICRRAFYEKVNFCPSCDQKIDWSE